MGFVERFCAWWYHDTVAEMQARMLREVRTLRIKRFRWFYVAPEKFKITRVARTFREPLWNPIKGRWE